ncbi:MAG: helical backbone metal receptor [Acidimicrobiales bacterium]|jgi:ABC-type Fe3+-hydroxamate transport system substrate-binding protein
MPVLHDDLGHPLELPGPPDRIVSLVPSLTEALAATCPDRLVGATDWCSHPAGLGVARVRGTKNPDLAAIEALGPDLVVANREENRRVDIDRLRSAGVPVWVTVVESIGQALRSMGRLITGVLDLPEPAWLDAARRAWTPPPALPSLRAVVPVWRRPWMVVGSHTFTGDVLTRLGLDHVFADADDRYPRVDLAAPEIARAELVLLPDEPYRFTADDGPEAFPDRRVVLVPGRDLTWYGPSMVAARAELDARIAAVIEPGGPGG